MNQDVQELIRSVREVALLDIQPISNKSNATRWLAYAFALFGQLGFKGDNHRMLRLQFLTVLFGRTIPSARALTGGEVQALAKAIDMYPVQIKALVAHSREELINVDCAP